MEKIAVSWRGSSKSLWAKEKLSDFLKDLKETFRQLPENFTMTFKDEKNNTRQIISEKDYIHARKLKAAITLSEVPGKASRKEVKKLCSQDLIIRGHSAAILDEKNCTKLEVVDEGDSIELSEGHVDSEDESKEEMKELYQLNVPMRPCISCNGYRRHENGAVCDECGGLGKMNTHMYNYIQQLIEKVKKEKSKSIEELEFAHLKKQVEFRDNIISVSYTHLTLPTICSV
eukprot:TRINITY_DN14545_c0_g1_i2.p1 TRINITY_DN14545_c0_g1~~TRINITY_DN14545_c0_g1_i2.p1  ORF type:complete len:230 (-),score=68.46 TRINITY_DN14545_c0_g1_i2:37-726(-)